jgi:hypothetical protein
VGEPHRALEETLRSLGHHPVVIALENGVYDLTCTRCTLEGEMRNGTIRGLIGKKRCPRQARSRTHAG